MYNKLRKFGVIPFAEVNSEMDAVSVADALEAGGLPLMEMPFRTFSQSRALRRAACLKPNFLIGASRILTREQYRRAIDCGSKFTISPGIDPDLVHESIKDGVAYLPGVATPTDVLNAMKAGVTHFHFFPAHLFGGAEMLKLLADQFSHLGVEFFVSGGVTRENIGEYLRIPEVSAVTADWLVPPDRVAAKDWEYISDEARMTLETIKIYRP